MATYTMPPQVSPTRKVTRFDRRLAKILEHATAIFCEKGYEGASMRDLSRTSGMSLAGLYYYFESKEKLLYLVQKRSFHHRHGVAARASETHAGRGRSRAD